MARASLWEQFINENTFNGCWRDFVNKYLPLDFSGFSVPMRHLVSKKVPFDTSDTRRRGIKMFLKMYRSFSFRGQLRSKTYLSFIVQYVSELSRIVLKALLTARKQIFHEYFR